MMAVKHARPTLGQVMASGVDLDLMESLDELSESLLCLSGVVARMRRAAPSAGEDTGRDLRALDAVASRSIALTRAIRERVQARRARGEYNSVCQVVRELAGQIAPLLPPEVSLTVDCAAGPALVAIDREVLRRVLCELIESSLAAMASGGELALEVTELAGARASERAVAQIELRSSAAIAPSHASFVSARATVQTLGGTAHVRACETGETAILLRMPGV